MASVKRWLNLRPQYVDGNGAPANGYRLFFYVANSSTKQSVYTDSAGSVASANPLTLNSLGEPPNEVWMLINSPYKVGLAAPGADDPPGAFVWTEDNITPVNDISVNTNDLGEWRALGAPTYISSTQFTLIGDQRALCEVNRRGKASVTGGTSYFRFSSVTFGAGVTTVTVDTTGSIALDSGLSSASYALLSATNPSVPVLTDAMPLMRNSANPLKLVGLSAANVTTRRTITMPDYDVALDNVPMISGQCRLTFVSTTQIKLIPKDGTTIPVAGVRYTIPSAGITSANTNAYINGASGQAASANTIYDVFVCLVGGVLTLELWNTATGVHMADPVTGIECRDNGGNADNTRTYVGKIRTDGSGLFSAIYLRSWLKDPGFTNSAHLTTARQTTSLSYAEINSEIRTEFLSFAEEVVDIFCVGGFGSNGINTAYASLGIDGITPENTFNASATGLQGTLALMLFKSGLSEGYHYATLLGKQTVSGTITFIGGASVDRTTLKVRCKR